MGANQKRSNSITGFMALSIATAVTLFLFVLTTPKYQNIQSLKIAPDAVSVLPHESSGPFRRKRVGELEYDLHSAVEIPKETRRQYTHKFNLEQLPSKNGEVFIPVIGGDGTVYVNGVRIGDIQNRDSIIPGFPNGYVHLDIPTSTYQLGINRLIIVMSPDISYGGIKTIYIGKVGDFSQAAIKLNSRFDLFLNIVLTGGLSLIFISILGLFQRPKFFRYFPIFGIGSVVIVLALVCKLGSSTTLNSQVGWGMSLYIILGCLLTQLFIQSSFKLRPILLGLWCAAILSVVLGLAKLLPIAWPFYVSQLALFCVGGALPFGIAFGLYSLSEDRQITRVTEKTLQEKVARQEAVIAAQEKAIEDGLKAKGRLEERQRLTRDIHDGIGGHLLSLLVRVRSGDMEQVDIENDLQHGLNDLRLIVDSMDHSEGTLNAALVTFRARVKAQLSAANISLKWEQSDPFHTTYFGPADILNIYRFMQEAVTNTIRHARCDELIITVATESEQNQLLISLSDNGVGFSSQSKFGAGQGLKNMQFRAKALNGELIFSKRETGGTKISLSVPVKPHSEVTS